MDRPRIYVDFNEMLEPDLVLLARLDTVKDSSGAVVHLQEGTPVCVYMDDLGDDGAPDNLIADGVAERNVTTGWGASVAWCCRIGEAGIRHESDIGDHHDPC